MRLREWLDDRTGYRTLARHALEEPVLGGARWAYVFGSALAILFVIQAVTGILLALYYSPSSQEAWGSVYFISHDLTLGWFIRGLHHHGASAMVIILVVHMLQVFLYGAYRRPRELAWWTGIVLLFITLGFSLTGYLLPWDQKGFWATRVVTSITGTFPFIGQALKATVQGGNDFGNLTLTRFFAFHVFFLPAALTGVVALHIYLFRRNGVTPRWSRTRAELEAKSEPFWPRQLTYDVIFAALVVAVIVAYTLREHGARLDAPADPSSNYLARPEWYFLWLFELLKLFPGRFEGTFVFGFVLLAVVFLFALPLADRSPDASLRSRWVHVVIAAILVGTIGTVTVKSLVIDARDPAVQRQQAAADAAADRAFALAELGIPPGGAGELYLNDPRERGKRLFVAQCQACHKAEGAGGDAAPDLSGFMTRAWVKGVIADPTTPFYFGRSKVVGMEKTDATPAELDILTDYTMSLGGRAPAPAGGADLFEEKGCQTCHARAGEDPLTGPSLGGYGSRTWVARLIQTPAAAEFYGDQNQMPAFQGRLTDEQLADLLVYLLGPPPPAGGKEK